MGKRAEDLPLDNTPITDPPKTEDRFTPVDKDAPDDRDQLWYQFIGTIDDLLATGEYDWAIDSLGGIRETVEKTRRVSDAQRRAVQNIEAAHGRREGGVGRRYEGWRGRGR